MKRIIALALTALAFAAAAAPGNFIIPNDAALRNPSIIRNAPDYIDAQVLAANVAEVWTAPANARFVIFSGTCNFYARPAAAAAVPAVDVADGTASELNPAAWYFGNGATTVGLIAPTACVVTMSVYLGKPQ